MKTILGFPRIILLVLTGILISISPRTAKSQLFSNPSFEIYSTCPTNTSQSERAQDCSGPWADYFNDCYTGSCSGNTPTVPDNYYGTQTPRTGDAYMGVYYHGNYNPLMPANNDQILDTYAYLYLDLGLLTLQPGVAYDVEFYVSLGESSTMALSGIGALFSTTYKSPTVEHELIEGVVPQVISAQIIDNTTGWTKISGTFVASDFYKYMIIGCYKDGEDMVENVDYKIVTPVSTTCGYIQTAPQVSSAYYIEDVSIKQVSPGFEFHPYDICEGNTQFYDQDRTDGPSYSYYWEITNVVTGDIFISYDKDPILFLLNGTYTVYHETSNGTSLSSSTWTVTITYGYDAVTFTMPVGTDVWNSSGNPVNPGNPNPQYIAIKQLLEIPSGANLTMNQMKFKFGENAKVIVKKGAALTLNGTTFTIFDNCPDIMWEGVEVWGTGTASQIPELNNPDQGLLRMASNSLIEHAHTGVKLYNSGVSPIISQTGGMIQATGSKFRNNYKSVVFFDFHNPGAGEPANRSYMLHCSFICDDYLRDPSYVDMNQQRLGLHSFIRMNSVKGVRLIHNSFETKAGLLPVTLRGTGIYSYNSPTFLISGSSRFTGLTYGIELLSSGTMAYFTTVSNNSFENCQRGIYSEGTSFDRYIGNVFTIPGPSASVTFPTYGIYTDGSESYLMEGNTFTGAASLNETTYGNIARNTGDFAATISKNTFVSTTTGTQTEDYNPLINLTCNSYTASRSAWDINPVIDAVDEEFPEQIGQCGSTPMYSGNQFFDPCGLEFYHIASNIGFLYWTRVPADPNDPDAACSSSNVNINFCGGEVSSACTDVHPPCADAECREQLITEINATVDNVRRQALINQLIQNLMENELVQDVIEFLEDQDNDASRMMLVPLYIDLGALTAASQALLDIGGETTQEDEFVKLYTVLLDLAEDGKGPDEASEAQLDVIEEVAAGTAVVSANARAILEAYFNGSFERDPEVHPSARHQQVALVQEQLEVSLLPNPFAGQLNFRIKAPQPVLLSVIDILGRTLYSRELSAGDQQLMLETSTWQEGLYQVRILQDGELLYAEKLIRIK